MSIQNGRNLTQTIVDELGVAIVKGNYEGSKFPTEAALCDQFSASRNIVREAVKILSEKGLLRSRPRHGTSIRPEEQWNILDTDILRWLLKRKTSLTLLKEFFDVRCQIEPAAAALAAELASDEQIGKIRLAMDRMEAAELGDDDPLEADIAFHKALLEASNNRFFIQLSSLTETALRVSIRLTNTQKSSPGVVGKHLESHEVIISAIETRDAELAKTQTQNLFVNVQALIQKSVEMNKRPILAE